MTPPLIISRQEFRIAELLRMREQMQIDPPYQREGRIWTRERQQLLVDSIINGFDIPRVYLHRLRPPVFDEAGAKTLAVIDGRQRLETLWDFADGSFALAEEFALLEEEPNPAELDTGVPSRYGGMKIDDLKERAPHLYFRFLDYPLSVSVVDTAEEQLIEELFFRLNEGVPLTPAEKRNRGAILREVLGPLVREEGVFEMTKMPNRRQSHEDLLLRLLYLEDAGVSAERVPDLKKRQLDEFAASFRPGFAETWTSQEEAAARTRLRELTEATLPVLSQMRSIFEDADPLLGSVTTFLVYYLAVHELVRADETTHDRAAFVNFEMTISALRGVPEDELTIDALDLMEQFGQPTQGSTTGSYLQRRVELLLRFLRGELNLTRESEDRDDPADADL